MNEYKVTLELEGTIQQEFIKADTIEYRDGFILFYIKQELIACIFGPAAVIKK